MIGVRMVFTPTAIQASAPRTLFENTAVGVFRVARDGRFLMQLSPDGQSNAKPLTVVTNWFTAVQQ